MQNKQTISSTNSRISRLILNNRKYNIGQEIYHEDLFRHYSRYVIIDFRVTYSDNIQYKILGINTGDIKWVHERVLEEDNNKDKDMNLTQGYYPYPFVNISIGWVLFTLSLIINLIQVVI